MDKTIPDLSAAVVGIEGGKPLMVGGFGGARVPIELIHAWSDHFRTTGSLGNSTATNNNAGHGRIGIAARIDHGRMKRMVCVPLLAGIGYISRLYASLAVIGIESRGSIPLSLDEPLSMTGTARPMPAIIGDLGVPEF